MNPATPAEFATVQYDEVHPSQRQAHIQPVHAPLYVVVGISNPMRYASRYRLFHAFRKYVHDSGALLTTVELALGDRAFEVTDPRNPNDVQVRSDSILWQKEDLINAGIRHVLNRTNSRANYFAWIDSDVIFARPDWVSETVHLLQTFSCVQMWSHAFDLGPDGQPLAQYTSFFYDWTQNEAILQPWSRKDGKQQAKPALPRLGGSHPTPPPGPLPKVGAHTGYAFAATRDALEATGLLGDIGILGSGDRSMAYALVGETEKSFPAGIQQSYKDYWFRWQADAEQHIRRNVGAMNGTLLHQWHGSKQHRRYQDRWRILVDDKFDWTRDIRRDSQGLWTWTHQNPKLERDVRVYFQVRSEDSIDIT